MTGCNFWYFAVKVALRLTLPYQCGSMKKIVRTTALDRLHLHLERVSFISWQDCKSVGGTSDHQSRKETWHSFSARASSLNLNHHQKKKKKKKRLCLWKLTLPIKQHTWCSQHMMFLNRSWLSFYWITSTEGYKVVTVVFVVVLSINLTKCSLC